MKTKQIMKIEYTEPLMKVKEMSRRRCVVASDTTNAPFTMNNEYTPDSDDQDNW